MFGPLDTGEGGGVTPSAFAGEGTVGLWVLLGVKEELTRVSQREHPAEGGQWREAEFVSGGGISLEVVEMASNDLLDVDAGGI
eukprot:g18159.t1